MSSVLSLRVPMNTLLKNMPGKLSHFSNNGAKPSRHRLRDLSALAKSLDPSIEASPLVPAKEITLRAGNGITIARRLFDGKVVPGRERFLQEIRAWLGQVSRVETAEFEITGIEEIASAPLTVRPAVLLTSAMTSSPSGTMSGVKSGLDHGTPSGRTMNQEGGKPGGGRPAKKHSALRTGRCLLT